MNISKMNIDETNIREAFLDIVTRRRPNIFLVDAITSREITYGDFHRQACALAAELRRRGVRKGDRVGVMVPNCCELAVLYFACIYLGAVIVPINPALSKTDVQFILTNCKPKRIVASVSCVGAITNFEPNVLRLATARDVIKESKDSGLIRIDALSETGDFVLLETADAEDLVAIMYTSGTSAKPKGLAHNLGSMLRNANAFATAQQIDKDTRFYLTLSMAYMGGFYNLLVLPFLCGASVVVDHVFDARSSLHFWEKARNNHVNTLWLAPTVLSILLRMDRGRTGEEFCRSSVRHTFVGFAPLPLKVKREFESRYGVRLIENYGLSETLFVTARTRDVVEGNGYVGEMLPGVALCVVNDDGKPVDPGVEGEVQILTPDLMAGYVHVDGRLMEMDASVWFPTGDVGHLDDSGSLFITGRKKDLIIRGGVNISPAAIEEELIHIKGVVDVAVVSIPHELYGEDIVAVLKLERGVELESMLDLVLGHAKRNLAQHQQPARYMAIDEFPRTANGKVQKARIRELVAEKLQVGSLLALRTHETRVPA
ncbi:MAG TPA: class I adenylate-forming enzyme family protein [Candidatus Eremiobacteraceae bacterium]|nr:class I adenylate-forming enzyme family protein [Candidatus Eremiobacteraceae bacterium]